MTRSKKFVAVLAFTLLLGTALAGCMEDGGSGDGDGGAALTSEEARTEVNNALSALKNTTTDYGSKVAVNVTFTNQTDGETRRGWMDFYLDADENEAISRMSGEALQTGGGATGSGGALVIAQMGKTVIIGAEKEALSQYNDSAEDVDNFGTLSETGSGSATQGVEPLFIFDTVQSNITTEIDEFDAREITYEGKEALEIESTTSPDGTDAYLRVVLWLDPKRPALVEANVPSEAAEWSSLEGAGELKMTFQYGADASIDIREALLRVETMTYSTVDSPSGFSGGAQGNWTNHTIQPSRDIAAGEVALSEAEAVVENGSARAESAEVIRMSLDEGSAETDEARLVYEDADGDGMVSEGDEIRMERLDENASLSLSLHDTETGWKVVPSSGVAVALAAAGAAAALVRPRRRR